MALIRVPNAGAKGVIKDIGIPDLPIQAWTDANNIRFLDGSAYQFYGQGKVYGDPLFTPTHVMPVISKGIRYWIYTSHERAAICTIIGGEAIHTDITRASGVYASAYNSWTSCALGGVPVLNPGQNSGPPQMWDLDTAHKLVNLPNWPADTVCHSIRSFKNYLVALGVTKNGTSYPYLVKWSSGADPGAIPSSWDETDPTIDAGESDLAEGYDQIVDGLQLRDFFMIYKEASIWRMDYVGGAYIFSFKKVLGTSGALNRNCIVEVDGYHLVLTGSDVIIHDGYTSTSILDKQCRRYMFQDMDVTGLGRAFVFKNPFMNEVFVCYASLGHDAPNRAMVWNYVDKTVTFRDIPNLNHAGYGPVDNGLDGNWEQDPAPWAADLTIWNGPDFTPAAARVIMASDNGPLYLLDSTSSFDGEIPEAYLEKSGISFDVPENIKLIRGVRPRITGNLGNTVIVQCGGQDDPYGPVVWGPEMEFIIGKTVACDCLISGRYIAVRFKTGTAYQWRLDSYDIDVKTTGKW